MERYEIKYEDIKPVGNFQTVLEKFDTYATTIIGICDDNKSYDSGISKILLRITGVIESLEEGLIEGDIWNEEEAVKCLLYSHLLLIRLNNCAQRYINNHEMEDDKTQLINFIELKSMGVNSVFQNITII